MSQIAYPLKLSLSIKREAQRLAKEDGVSLNHWISLAVAQKIAVVETSAEFLKRRSNGATGDELGAILDRVPDVAPMLGDEFPEYLKGERQKKVR